MIYKANFGGNVNADPVAYNKWQWDINHGRLSPVNKPKCRQKKTTEAERLSKEEEE